MIEVLKGKFSQYNNFYVTDTESLTVEQVGKLRRACFDKQVEMKVAKNTLIKKALESLDNEKYAGVYDSLHKVTALMFSENPKDPALIISSFRKESNGERPVMKAAFINGDVYMGDNQLVALTKIKTKNELIGEVIGLLQSPAKRVLAALLHHHEQKAAGAKWDKTRIIYNSHVTISKIPLEAYEYVVNGKPAIEWVMERYQYTRDKDSGIVNDPNDWCKEHKQPRYIADLIVRVVRVSMETMKIVKNLPALNEVVRT